MIFTPLPIAGAFVLELEQRNDSRGFFARLYCETEFAVRGLTLRWVQCNTSLTHKEGSIRGLHLQRTPVSETKLIRCIQGAVFDVLVDLRPGSPTFRKWQGVELSAENRRMVLIPEGCAHGFQTLLPETELLYFHSQFYTPSHEFGFRFDDPDVGIRWPRPVADLSSRDAALPELRQLKLQ